MLTILPILCFTDLKYLTIKQQQMEFLEEMEKAMIIARYSEILLIIILNKVNGERVKLKFISK